MDRLSAEDVARARGLLAAALPPKPGTPQAEASTPEPVDPRRAAERARIKAYAEQVVKDWPPLTDEQLAKVTAIMRPTLRRSA